MVRASCVGRPARWKGTILRLTRIPNNDPGVTLRAEGRVVGEWSMLLERECAAAAGEFGVVHLDLAAVAYVDTKGVAALKRLMRSHVTISSCPPLVQELLGEDNKP